MMLVAFTALIKLFIICKIFDGLGVCFFIHLTIEEHKATQGKSEVAQSEKTVYTIASIFVFVVTYWNGPKYQIHALGMWLFSNFELMLLKLIIL